MNYHVYKDLELDFQTFSVTIKARFCLTVSRNYYSGEYEVDEVECDDYEIMFQCSSDGDFLENLSDEQEKELNEYLDKYTVEHKEEIECLCEVDSDDFRDD